MIAGKYLHPRAAFSLVELLVALALLGVGVTALASALVSDVRIRDLAAGESGAAVQLRDRLESLAAAPCTSDTASVDIAKWGRAIWHASPYDGAWHLVDSIVPIRVHRAYVVEARVACPQ